MLLVGLLLPLTVNAGDSHNLPDIGDPSGSVITPEFERRLGQAIMRQVRQSTDVIQDPEVDSYIQSIGYSLVANSDGNQVSFIFFVIRNPAINAFAAPGGVVGVNSGVILNSDSESELAGVLAHEIAHVTQRHMARTYEVADKFGLPTMAAMIGAILIGIANPQAGQAALAAVAGFSSQYQINFTRANEEEADRVGMQLLARSNFDPFGMPNFFKKLQQTSRYYQGNAPEYLMTHPLTSNRIAESISRAEQYPRKPYQSTATFKLVRAKLMAESFKTPGEAIKFFENAIESGGYPDIESARYGYVIALTNAAEYNRAKKQLQILLDEDNENVYYLLAAARLEASRRNFTNSVGLYQEAHKLYPDYWPVVAGFSRALLDAGQPENARQLLRDYGRTHEPSLLYYDLLSQAEAESGALGESDIAKAEYYYLLGGTHLAIERLKFAQRQTDLSYYQMERIKARLAQLEYELQIERELELAPDSYTLK